jgi:hypothetical protein
MDNSANVVSAKQQIVERIKQSTNILITVSTNPSVDALSSALALTLMLNKMDKHATAVFSGAVPPAIKFLQPEKMFEHTIDSLRDFIIALDKEKADRLRYKVENDVVRIYITPYRTPISERDLKFSQGELNVDLILALGVEKREELDKAIAAHGRILHDATIMTINAANQKSTLGSVDWQDTAASSLSEMLVSMSESLQSGLLDPQISTALLTGIVAATDRFSNQRTTPRVMTMAAQLMAAGANQQLIASSLAAAAQMAKPASNLPGAEPKPQPPKPTPPPAPEARGEMFIKHEGGQPKAQPPAAPTPPVVLPAQEEFQVPLPAAPPAASPAQQKSQLQAETDKLATPQKPAQQLQPPKPQTPQQPQQSQQPKNNNQPKIQQKNKAITNTKPSWMDKDANTPTFGGSLSATAEEALEDKMRDEVDQRNHTLLTHFETPTAQQPANPTLPPLPSSMPSAPMQPPVLNPTAEPAQSMQPSAPASTPQPVPASLPPEPTLGIGSELPNVPMPNLPPTPQLPPQPAPALLDTMPLNTEPSIEQLEKAIGVQDYGQPDELAAARQAVSDAYATPAPAEQPQPVQQPEVAPLPAPEPISQSQPAPSLPPLPDFSTLPPAMPTLPPLPPTSPTPPQATPAPTQGPAPMANPSDPKQFKIPGAS